MNCPKCQLIEMRVDKVENNKIYYECKKCNATKVIDVSELENKDEK